MKRRALVAHLKKRGCLLEREGARHSWFFNPQTKRHAAVPRHRGIVDVLAKRICRDLGVPVP